MNKEKLTMMVPFRWIGMTWIPLLIVAVLPSDLFYFLIKVVLLFWVFITIVSIWKHADRWTTKGYQTLQAFVTQNTILFAVILFLSFPKWVNSAISIWMMATFFTKFNQIKKANKKIQE